MCSFLFAQLSFSMWSCFHSFEPKKRSTLHTFLQFDFDVFFRLKLFCCPLPNNFTMLFFSLSMSLFVFSHNKFKKGFVVFLSGTQPGFWRFFVRVRLNAPFGCCGTFFPASTKSCCTFLSSWNKTIFFHKTRTPFCFLKPKLWVQRAPKLTLVMHKKYHQAEKKKRTLWSSQNSRDENDDFKKYQQLVTGLDKALTDLFGWRNLW